MTGKRGPRRQAGATGADQLLEANESLVLATLNAQALEAASQEAAARVREANEHLVVAMVHAQMMREQAEQATAQLACRSRMEAQLVEAQRLETLSLLAGGVAHDFNNLITTIMGYADLGRMATEPGSDPARFFAAIDQAAVKAAELTRQLLAYAGKGECRVAEVDLGIVVKEIALLLSVSIPAHVTLHYQLADRLPYIKGDPTQVFQLVMNLFTNAAEACPAGRAGRITFTTASQEVDQAALGASGWIQPMAPGRYATLEVSDNGTGMSAAVLARILDPFFTTKPNGHGLGLAAVTGILRGHGGGLKVVSEPGQGSAFTLFLPAMAEARLVPGHEPLPVWRGSGNLLIVEPDPGTLSQAGHLAVRLGFKVISARSGPEAVAIFGHRHGEISLVLMALELPGMGGAETLRAMQSVDRRVPVVLSSGFQLPDPPVALEGLSGQLKTPFRVAEFRGLLQRTLDPQPIGS